MMRCLRIFGAYSFRLTRRHSTVLLIAFFIVAITVILQLYSYRHHDGPLSKPKIGDFDYKPGEFLKGLQPNENVSYCEFNYGLPETIKWSSVRLYYSPEQGNSSNYRVIYNAIIGTAFSSSNKYNALTYATQATPEYLYHIVEIARFWDGPISLAVYVPSYDLDITMQIMNQLCHCYPGMAKVSLHLFYHKMFPPKILKKEERIILSTAPPVTPNVTFDAIIKANKMQKYRQMDRNAQAKFIETVRKKKIKKMMARLPKSPVSPTLQFEDCSGLDTFDMTTFRRYSHMTYPVNVGRNVARNASLTNYFIVSDIEMVPSDGLAPRFLTMIKKLMGDKKRNEGCIFAKTVFVVPLFQVERGEKIPRDKRT